MLDAELEIGCRDLETARNRRHHWAIGPWVTLANGPEPATGGPEPGEADADPGQVAREMRLRGQSLEGGPSRSGQMAIH